VRAKAVVCYDKNIPNAQGVQKLSRVLGKLLGQFDVRVVLVAPERLGDVECDRCWERVRARGVEEQKDRALTTHIDGGEAKAWSIFKDCFFDSCIEFLPALQASGIALHTDIFWGAPEGGDGSAASRAFISAQRWAEFVADPSKVVPGFSVPVFDLPFQDDRDARHSPGAWASAEVAGTAFHVTLVPPANPRALTHEAGSDRESVLVAVRGLRGQKLRVELVGYCQATTGTDVPFCAGNRQDSIGLWEVGRIEGLPAEAELSEQRDIYHVTDLAALTQSRRPKAAAELLRALRGLAGLQLSEMLGAGDWSVRRFELSEPLIVEATVTIHDR